MGGMSDGSGAQFAGGCRDDGGGLWRRRARCPRYGEGVVCAGQAWGEREDAATAAVGSGDGGQDARGTGRGLSARGGGGVSGRVN
jgi:hypothetical protein